RNTVASAVPIRTTQRSAFGTTTHHELPHAATGTGLLSTSTRVRAPMGWPRPVRSSRTSVGAPMTSAPHSPRVHVTDASTGSALAVECSRQHASAAPTHRLTSIVRPIITLVISLEIDIQLTRTLL